MNIANECMSVFQESDLKNIAGLEQDLVTLDKSDISDSLKLKT